MMNKKIRRLLSAASLFLLGLLPAVGCNSDGGGSDVSDGTGSEIASAAMGGIVGTSEGSVSAKRNMEKPNFLAKLKRGLNPISTGWAVPGCDWPTLITSCNANAETISFDGCSSSNDRAILIQGSETLFWTGNGCCTSKPLTASSETPCSFIRRTVNKFGESDPLIRSVGAHSITLDTEGSSGHFEQKSGGFSVGCQGSGTNATCDGQRQITIQGAHYTGRSGRASWDHTVSTDLPLVVQGHDSSRKVLSGKVRVQHNLAHYVSVTVIEAPLTYQDSCCFPTGGTVTTSFSGGALDGKSEKLTYGPGCGNAQLENSDHKQSGFELHHCL
jgi:hypothetical protein